MEFDIDRLCSFTEVEPGRWAETLHEEILSALIFSTLMGTINVLFSKPITARELLKTVFCQWVAAEFPLFDQEKNCLTGSCPEEPDFSKAFSFLPNVDYDALVDLKEYASELAKIKFHKSDGPMSGSERQQRYRERQKLMAKAKELEEKD